MFDFYLKSIQLTFFHSILYATFYLLYTLTNWKWFQSFVLLLFSSMVPYLLSCMNEAMIRKRIKQKKSSHIVLTLSMKINMVLDSIVTFILFYFFGSELIFESSSFFYTIVYINCMNEILNLVFYMSHRAYHIYPILFEMIHAEHHKDNNHLCNTALYYKSSILENILTGPLLTLVIILSRPPTLYSYFTMIYIFRFILFSSYIGLHLISCTHVIHLSMLPLHFIPKSCYFIHDHESHHEKIKGNYGIFSMLIDKRLSTFVK